MKEIIIKESAKSAINKTNYSKVLKEVTTSKTKTGIIGRLNYLIKSNAIILF
jgi:hypothetical protein